MIRRKDIMFLIGIMMCFFSSHNTLSQSKDNDLQLNDKTILLSNTFNKEYRYITTYNVNELGIRKNNNWEICYGEGVFANYFDDFTSITTIKQKIILCWENFRDIFLNKSIYKPYNIFYFRDVLMCLFKMFFTNDIEYLLYCFGNYKILYQSSIVGMTYTYNLYNAFFNKTDLQALYKGKDNNIEDDKKTVVDESRALCCLCNTSLFKIKKIKKNEMFRTLHTVNDNVKEEKITKENLQTENIPLNKMLDNEENSYDIIDRSGTKKFPCCGNYFHDECVDNYNKKRARCANCNRRISYNGNEYGYDMFLTLFFFKKQITVEYSDINKIFFIMPFFRVSFIFLPTIYMEPILYFYNYTIAFYELLNIFQKTTLGINLSCKIEVGFSYLNKHFFSFYIKPTLSLLKELFFGNKKYNPFSIIFGIEYFVNGKGTNSRI